MGRSVERRQVLWFLRELSTPADKIQALETTLSADLLKSWKTETARRIYNAQELMTDDCGHEFGEQTSDFLKDDIMRTLTCCQLQTSGSIKQMQHLSRSLSTARR